jgi:amidase
MGYSAGGSSSGSAVLVALGEVDMALGGDQGGSIRMPSSFCGTYGMKPTHGLVPYTGIMPIEIYVDHTGPITSTVADNALLLEVLAGPDGYDPRQYDVKVHPYTKAAEGGVKGMKIAVVKEGFSQPNAEAIVNEKVRAAIGQLEGLGAEIRAVSIPMHLMAGAIWMPIGVEGLTQTMMWGDGYGVSRPDLYVTSLMDFHHGWRARANELFETTKLFTMFGTYSQTLRQPLLWQSDEHLPSPDRGLRRGARRMRAAGDADDTHQGDRLAAPRCEPRRLRRPGAQHDLQHRAIRHHPSPRVGDPMWDG